MFSNSRHESQSTAKAAIVVTQKEREKKQGNCIKLCRRRRKNCKNKNSKSKNMER
jgi:hypothetical protein